MKGDILEKRTRVQQQKKKKERSLPQVWHKEKSNGKTQVHLSRAGPQKCHVGQRAAAELSVGWRCLTADVTVGGCQGELRHHGRKTEGNLRCLAGTVVKRNRRTSLTTLTEIQAGDAKFYRVCQSLRKGISSRFQNTRL